MSEKEMHSFRLSSNDDPTDEQLFALMEQIGEAGRATTKRVALIHQQRLLEIAQM